MSSSPSSSVSAGLLDAVLGTRPEIGGRTGAGRIVEALGGIEANFRDHRPRAVVVRGDTNSTVAGALAGNAFEVPVAHVEAGPRGFDRRMPEEHNR